MEPDAEQQVCCRKFGCDKLIARFCSIVRSKFEEFVRVFWLLK